MLRVKEFLRFLTKVRQILHTHISVFRILRKLVFIKEFELWLAHALKIGLLRVVIIRRHNKQKKYLVK